MDETDKIVAMTIRINKKQKYMVKRIALEHDLKQQDVYGRLVDYVYKLGEDEQNRIFDN